jgi:hypothetical protein
VRRPGGHQAQASQGPTSNHRDSASLSNIDFEEVLLDYEQLKKSLEGPKVDKSLTFVRDRSGIKRDDREHSI